MERKIKRKKINGFCCEMTAKSVNESFARGLVSCFCALVDPTVEELCDVKTAVSEAVTNSIVHAYRDCDSEKKKIIKLKGECYDDGLVCITVKDYGCGIDDVEKAMQPMFSGAHSEERSGMGFSIMKCFTDSVKVKSKKGYGTTVVMKKYIGKHEGN